MKSPLSLHALSTNFFRALFALIFLLAVAMVDCDPCDIDKWNYPSFTVSTIVTGQTYKEIYPFRWTDGKVKNCQYKQLDLSRATAADLSKYSTTCHRFQGTLVMENNPNAKHLVTVLEFRSEHENCNYKNVISAYIVGNDNLNTLDIGQSWMYGAKHVIIRGNRRLTQQSLDLLNEKYIAGKSGGLPEYRTEIPSEIQEFGECHMPFLNRMKALDDCRRLYNTMLINENTIIESTNAELESFQSITIENSNVIYLDFLKDPYAGKFGGRATDTLVLKNNKNLCISLNQQIQLGRKYNLIFSNNGDPNSCSVDCDASNSETTERCTHLNGNVVVDCGESVAGGVSDSIAAAAQAVRQAVTLQTFGLKVIGTNKLKQLNGALHLNNCPVSMINRYMDSSIIGNIQHVQVILKNPKGDLMNLNFDHGSPKRMEVHTKPNEYTYMKAADFENRHPFIYFMNAQKPPKGVCVFPRPTDSVKGCEKIEGDLKIHFFSNEIGKKKAVVEPILKEITGCLRLTNMMATSYEFLTKIEKIGTQCRWRGGKSGIRNRDCIPYSVRSRINLTELADMANHPSNYEKCGLEHCVFTSASQEITNCTLIDGDLVLDENSTTVETAITTVTGCISIVNTRLPNYDFLKTIESFNENCTFTKNTEIETTTIDNNTCVPYSVRTSMKSKELKKIIEAGNNKKGCGECPGATVEKLKDGCKVILGDLKVDKLTDKSKGKMEKRLATVEEVYGQVVITDNNASTIEFKNLRIVETNGSGPAIQIVNNPGLVTIETPALTRIVSKNVTKFLIEKNPKWNASETFRKKIKKVTGKECGTDKKSACYFQRVEEPKEEKKEDKKEEEGGLGAGATAAIVVVVLIVVLALVAGGVVAAVLVVRKKKSSKKGEAEGPAGKVPPPTGQKMEKGAKKSSVTPGKSTGKTSESKGGKKTKTTATGTKSKEALTPMTSNEAITPLGKNSKDRLTRTKSNEAMTPLGKKASKDALTPATGSTEALTPIGSKEAIKKPKVVAPNAKKPVGQPKPIKGKK